MSLKKPESTVNTDENDGNSFNAHDLLGEHSAAKIILGQEIYFLKLTKQNKLILTK
jgi:hemin uptake protein HemP